VVASSTSGSPGRGLQRRWRPRHRRPARASQHTTLSRGLVARFFGYGDIVIRSAGKGEEILKHMADADSFRLALLTAMRKTKLSRLIDQEPPQVRPL
jgi:hypothetical protein